MINKEPPVTIKSNRATRHAPRATKIMHCIGDSHVSFFSGRDWICGYGAGSDSALPYFKVYHIGPVLAYNLVEEGSATRGRETVMRLLHDQIPPGSLVLFCFGEIDCRYHLPLQAEKQQRYYQEVVRECVARYVTFLKEVQSMDYSVYVWNATPSASDALPMDSAYPRYGTMEDRNCSTRFFNNLLNLTLVREGIPFISIFDSLVDSQNCTREQFLMDGIHLSQAAMPMALHAFDRCVPNLFTTETEGPVRLWFSTSLPKGDWHVFDEYAAAIPETLCDFEDESVTEIYIDRRLSELDYARELGPALREMYRVLGRGGKLRVCVQDFATLSKMFIDPQLTGNQRFYLMRMMFGGFAGARAEAASGLTEEFLSEFLRAAGFETIRHYHDQQNDLTFFDENLLLCIEAEKG